MMSPFLHFYKLLALRPSERPYKSKVRVNLPDTVIFNDRDCPLIWMFTNQAGEVTRIDNIPYQTITSKFMEGALEKEVVAVLKKVLLAHSALARIRRTHWQRCEGHQLSRDETSSLISPEQSQRSHRDPAVRQVPEFEALSDADLLEEKWQLRRVDSDLKLRLHLD